MWRILYSSFFYLIMPFILMRLLFRSIQVPAYRQRIAERFGAGSLNLKSCIWVHAVSVGETLAAVPIIERLLERYPDEEILVTTMTPTGSDRVQAVFGQRVHHVYAPYDLPDSVKRFIRRVNPRLAIVMETELWPNILHYTHQAGCPSIIANARLSERSARGYKKLSHLTQSMLSEVTLLAAQANPDAQRFLELGLKPEQLTVTGSIKFDLTISEQIRNASAKARKRWGEDRLVFIAASTHEGEDEPILSVFEQLKVVFPSLLLVIVPRHPERFDAVAQMIEKRGWNMLRHSLHGADAGASSMTELDVLLGDTMGQLLLLYGASDVAFVGGSLVETGGHNVLEPLAFGVPAIVGPHIFNFQVISDLLLQAGALLQVENQEQLVIQVQALLENKHQRESMGALGKEVVEQNRGALSRLIAGIEKVTAGIL